MESSKSEEEEIPLNSVVAVHKKARGRPKTQETSTEIKKYDIETSEKPAQCVCQKVGKKRGRKRKYFSCDKVGSSNKIKEEIKDLISTDGKDAQKVFKYEVSQKYKSKLREHEDYIFDYKPPPQLKFNKELDSNCDEQNDYCHVCIDGGNIILCDSCPKVFHRACLSLKRQPTKSWLCPYCTGEWTDRCPICEEKCEFAKSNDNKQERSGHRGRKESKSQIHASKKIEKFGIECSLCKCITHLGCLEVPIFAVLDSPRYSKLSNKEKLEILQNYSKENILKYICRCCQESKEIEEVYAFMDKPKAQLHEIVPDDFLMKEQLFDDKQKKDYLYLVKFKKTAYYHSIWVDYNSAEEFNQKRLYIFCKKMREFYKTYRAFEIRDSINQFNSKSQKGSKDSQSQVSNYFNYSYLE